MSDNWQKERKMTRTYLTIALLAALAGTACAEERIRLGFRAKSSLSERELDREYSDSL